jgi:hypothetical protein
LECILSLPVLVCISYSANLLEYPTGISVFDSY